MFCVLLFRLPAVYPVHSFADRIRTLGICIRTHDSSTILNRKFDILHFSITAPRILGEGRAKLWKLALEAPPCISPLGRFRKCWQVCIFIKAIYVILRMYLIPECRAQSLQRCADSDDAKGSERGSSSPSRACPGAMGRRWTGPPVALRVLQARGIPGKPFRRE